MGIFEYYEYVTYSSRSHQRGQAMLGLGDLMTESKEAESL
jgi:hypothetical protein